MLEPLRTHQHAVVKTTYCMIWIRNLKKLFKKVLWFQEKNFSFKVLLHCCCLLLLFLFQCCLPQSVSISLSLLTPLLSLLWTYELYEYFVISNNCNLYIIVLVVVIIIVVFVVAFATLFVFAVWLLECVFSITYIMMMLLMMIIEEVVGWVNYIPI